MRRDCVHRPQFRSPRFVGRRQYVRDVLVILARSAPEPFVPMDLMPLFAQASGSSVPHYEYWAAFDFLRKHGFLDIERLGRTRHRYELSEQAVRWLDWTGFEWSARMLA